MPKSNVIPVIMSGGAGTRLWPASRQKTPKQLLSLVGDHTMLQKTAERLCGQGGSHGFGAPIIVCSAAHVCSIEEQLSDIGVKPEMVITEPVPRNTAPCAVIAALAVRDVDSDALMLLAPADHHIRNEEAFSRVISDGLKAAQAGYIVTFGITAKTPETGYGYIQKGEALDAHVRKVQAFKEKPNAQTALEYIESGQYSWNAGIFMCKPSVLLDEMQKYNPEILRSCQASYEASSLHNGIMPLNEALFAACPSDSIDYAVMEHTDKAAVIESDMGWSDIGSWSALWQLTHDADGNARRGDVHMIDTTNSLIHSDGPFIATLGVDNLAVVVHEGAVLVADMNNVQNVKKIVDFLKARGDKSKL
jgi:mannose-1-phosphate guanylyltransferase/mannose-1-phosphate guanylyltransferase/mannose-6-phosphate isomerase